MRLDSVRMFRASELELEEVIEVGSTALDVRFARSEDDVRWVAKLPLLGDSEIIAELTGWLLSRALDAAVTDSCGIWLDEEDRWWALSLYVDNASHWTSDVATRAENLDALGRVLAVDGVLWNEDRHHKNVLVSQRDRAVRVTAIDFGAALVGHPASRERKQLAPPAARARLEILEAPAARRVLDGVLEGAARLASLEERFLDELANQATRWCRRPSARDTLQRVLEDRCRHAHARVAAVGQTERERVVAVGDIPDVDLEPVHAEMIRAAIEEIRREQGLSRPEILGPQFELSAPTEIPEGVEDLTAWLGERTRDAWPLRTADVPQADDLGRVVDVAPTIAAGRVFVDTTPRQWAYYRHAARTLGLVDSRRDAATELGLTVARRPLRQSLEPLRVAFANSSCGRAWMEWSRCDDVRALPRGSALSFLEARVPDMADATRRRRAQTLERWREALTAAP